MNGQFIRRFRNPARKNIQIPNQVRSQQNDTGVIMLLFLLLWWNAVAAKNSYPHPTKLSGSVVVLNSRGTLLVSGSPNEAVVYTYTISHGNWVEAVAPIFASTLDCKFGYSLAISENVAPVLVVGAPHDLSGSAWIYAWGKDGWALRQQLYVPGIGDASFGFSVAISTGDGGIVAVGAPRAGTAGTVYIFRTQYASTGTLALRTTIVPATLTQNAQFGCSVSLSRDANTLVVGARFQSTGVGSTWLYTSTDAWTTNTELLLSSDYVVNNDPAKGVHQGYAVALNVFGNTVFSSAVHDANTVGTVWMHSLSVGAWTHSQVTIPDYIGKPRIGSSIAVSGDGNSVVFGGPYDNNGIGAVWVYTLNTATLVKLTATDNIGASHQGSSVSISQDGTVIAVGGDFDGLGAGATWVWTLKSAPTGVPTRVPTIATSAPTGMPSTAPSASPSRRPVVPVPTADGETNAPIIRPSSAPRAKPTKTPIASPTKRPSAKPTKKPVFVAASRAPVKKTTAKPSKKH